MVKDGLMIYKYEGGNSKKVGTNQEGLSTGLWTEFYESGKIWKKGEYLIETGSSFKEGEWEEYDEATGSRSSLATYKHGKREGKATSYYTDGAKKTIIPWVGGTKSGEAIQYYPSGEKKKTGSFVAGSREGNWTEFYKNGKEKSISIFKKGTQTGSYKVFHPNGKNKIVGQFDEKGKKTGAWLRSDAKGKTKSKEIWLEDKKDMNWELYQDGILMEKVSFATNITNGPYELFDEKGKLKTKSIFIFNSKEGEETSYHPNGKVSASGIYKKKCENWGMEILQLQREAGGKRTLFMGEKKWGFRNLLSIRPGKV